MKSGNDREAMKGLLASLVCHVCWGLSFLASRTGLNEAPVFVLLSHRFLLSFLVMQCFPRQVAGLRRVGRDLPLLLALGLAQPVVYFLGEQYGILHSTTGFSGVMIAMIPVVSVLAAAPLLRERPTLGQLCFSLLSVGGVIGIGLMTRSSGRTSPFARTYAMTGMGAAVFTLLALIQCRGDLAAYCAPLAGTPYLLSVLFLALGCSVLSFFLSNYALTKLPLARETVFANLTTAVSVFAGVLVLHEPFSWLTFVCIALILIGIWGVQRTARD